MVEPSHRSNGTLRQDGSNNIDSYRRSTSRALNHASLLLIKEVIVYGLRFGRLIILTRFLSPEDFGVFALAAVLISGCQTLTALGPRTYLVQRPSLSDRAVDTVWTIDVLRAVALSVLGIPLAFLISDPSVNSSLPTLLIALPTIIVLALRSPASALAERSVRFEQIAAAELSGAFAGFLLSVGLGVVFRSPIALSAGLLAGTIVEIGTSWIFFPRRVRFIIDRDEARAFIRIGRNLLAVSAGTFLLTQGDYVVVQSFVGTAALGVYLLAYRLTEIPSAVMSNVGSRLGTAVLSRRSEASLAALDSSFARLVKLGAPVAISASMVLISLARPAVEVSFGANFTSGVPVVRLLALVVLGRGLSQLFGALMNAHGDFGLAARFKLLEVIVFLALVPAAGYLWGLMGVASAVGTTYVFALSLRVWYANRLFGWPRTYLPRTFLGISIPWIPATLLSIALEPFGNRLQSIVGGLAFGLTAFWWFGLRRKSPARELLFPHSMQAETGHDPPQSGMAKPEQKAGRGLKKGPRN